MNVHADARVLVSLGFFPLVAAALLVLAPTRSPTSTLAPATAAAVGAVAGLGLFAARAAVVTRRRRSGERARAPLGVAATAAVIGASEEVVWRGFLLARTAAVAGTPAALVATSLGFALSHYPAYGRNGTRAHVVSGFVFGGTYLATGSVLACATAHVLYNLLALRSRERAAAATSAVDAERGAAVVLRSVHKRFGPTVALAGLDLSIRRGELVTVLGPNGAGKSTAISIVLGLRRADAGTVRVLGEPPAVARACVGATPQEMSFPPSLRTREIVEFVRAHYADALPADELLRRFALEPIARRQTGGLSGGERRRLAVALAFAGRPRLAVLDEPTTGLDIEARRQVWEVIREYVDTGGAVLLTTHSLEEAHALADRVVVVARGRAVAVGTPEELTRRAGLPSLEEAFVQLTRERR